MSTVPVESFNAASRDTGNTGIVVGIDNDHTLPQFVLIVTEANGTSFCERAQIIRRLPSEEEEARAYFAARNARRSELGR